MSTPKASGPEPTHAAQRSALVWSLVCLSLACAFLVLGRVLERFQPHERVALESSSGRIDPMKLAQPASRAIVNNAATPASTFSGRPSRAEQASTARRASSPPNQNPSGEEVEETRPLESEAQVRTPEPEISSPAIVSLEEIAANPNDRGLIQQFLISAAGTNEGAVEIEKLKAMAIESPTSVLAEEISAQMGKEGKQEEATEWYRRALQKNPPNPDDSKPQIGISEQVLRRSDGKDQM